MYVVLKLSIQYRFICGTINELLCAFVLYVIIVTLDYETVICVRMRLQV